MSQLDRILQRQPHVDKAEVQNVRALAIARLSALSDQHEAAGSGEAEPPSADTANRDPATAEIVVVDHAEPIVLPAGGLWATAPADVIATTGPIEAPDAAEHEPRVDPVRVVNEGWLPPVDPPHRVIVVSAPARTAPAPTHDSAPQAVLDMRPPTPSPGRAPRREAAAKRPGRSRAVATAYCPYCALSLDPPPTTDRRCTRCRQRIVVRQVERGRLVHLTEAAVRVFEAERERAANVARWTIERRRWLDLALISGAQPSRVERLDRPAASLENVNAARAFYDATVDAAVDEAFRQGRWDVAARHRREQANTLRDVAGRALPPRAEVRDLYRAAATLELRGIATLARTAAVAGARCCDACRADEGTEHRIAAELRTSRLPHANCPTGPCRCHWDLAPDLVQMVERYRERTRGSSASAADPT